MTRRISVEEAREFFAHPSQLRGAMLGSVDDLPDEGFEYWSDGPICGAFHPAPWSGVWFAHYGAHPEGWGSLKIPAQRVLRAFCAASGAACLIGWTNTRNRAAIAFARRLGFEITGTIDAGRVTATEWRPEWQLGQQ